MVVRSKYNSLNQKEKRLASPMNNMVLQKWILLKRLVILAIPLGYIMFTSVERIAPHTFRSTNETVIGMMQYLPPDYHSNSDKYPLVIFLHGIVEKGVNSSDPIKLRNTVSTLDNLGPPRNVRKGQDFPFILISPQLKSNWDYWPDWYVLEVVNWAKNTLRVDEKRIHITGLSLGGGATFSCIQENPTLFASGSPVCAYWNNPAKAVAIARENVAVWAFHGADDNQVPLHTNSFMIDSINRCSPPPDPKAQLTVYSGSRHNIWDRAYIEDNTYHTPNLYEWLMTIQKKKIGSNYLPTAHAGEDQSYVGVQTISLAGSGSDPDGIINSYRWTQLNGPLTTISNPSNAVASVSLPRRGTYTFKLTVTDTDGATDTDFVKVTVN